MPEDSKSASTGSAEGEAKLTPNFDAQGLIHLPEMPIDMRYMIHEEVGRGGMGVVYRATDKFLDREVAFKQLLLNQRAANLELTRAATITLGERFLREARITAQLDHPSIIPVYEIAERDDGNIFYTMKFVRGLNIGKHIKAINNDKSLNDDQRLAKRLGLLGHFVDACNALAYAHSKDVLHRDIKPENIMLGKYGETFLVDWGLAKVLGEDEAIEQRVRESGTVFVEDLGPAHLTQDGAIFGTPAYLSPEQARGRHDEISNLSDVYSMGAVLFEIVSGACPIPGQNLRETIFRAASGDHDNLAEVCPNAPDELVVIVERAMQNEAADRFQSPTELAAEVEAWREGAQVSIYQYSSLQLLRRFLSRHKGPLFAAGLMVLLTLGFFAFSAWQDAAEFEEAVDERRQALTQAKGVIEGKGTATLLEDAKAEIARIKTQRDAHTSNQPVPLLEANENAQAMRSADLLDAAQAISDRLVLAERPIRNQHVELLDEEEVKAESALAQDLRFSAARLEALRGGYKLAEEIVRGAHASADDSAELLTFISRERERLKSMRRERIAFVLDDIHQGLGRRGRAPDAPILADYVFELVGYRDQQTVALLKAELATYVEALEAHQAARRALPQNKANEEKVIERAINAGYSREEAWAIIRFAPRNWTQEERDSIALCARVLGSIGLPDAASDALAPILGKISDHDLAIEIAREMVSTKSLSAWQPLYTSTLRLGSNNGTAKAINRLLPRMPSPAEMEIGADCSYLERARFRAASHDHEGAIADFRKALEASSTDNERSNCWNAIGSANSALQRFDEAIDAFKKSSELFPDSAAANSNLGSVYIQLDRLEDALDMYNLAISKETNSGLSYHGRARVYLAQGKNDLGLADLATAIRYDPENAYFRSSRGDTYYRLGKHAAAIRDLSTAIGLDPNDDMSYYYRGQVREAMGEYIAAADDFSRAIELNPSNASAFAARAFIRFRQSNTDGALTDVNKAIEIQADNVYALSVRGRIYESLDDTERALADFDAALAISPDNMSVRSSRAGIYLRRKELEKAAQEIDSLVELNSESGYVYTLRGRLHYERKEYASAEKDHLKAVELAPESSRTLIGIAYFYHQQKQYEKALLAYDKLVALGMSPVSAYLNRASCHSEMGNAERAYEDAERALEIDPRDYSAMLAIGRYAINLDRFQEAEGYIRGAISLKPTDPSGYGTLGMLRRREKRYRDALEAYQQALDLDPDYAGSYMGRALAFWALDEIGSAKACVNEAIKRDFRLADSYVIRGKLRKAEGDGAGVLADYAAAIAADPSSSAGYSARATYYVSKGEAEKAREDADAGLKLNPRDTGLLAVRAYLAGQDRRYEDAIADYTKCIEIDPRHRGAHAGRGYAYRSLERHAEALADFEAEIALGDPTAQLFGDRGMALRSMRRHAEALEAFDQAIKAGMETGVAYYYRGNARHLMDDWEGAINDFETALSKEITEALRTDIENHLTVSRTSQKWEPWLTKETKAIPDRLKRIEAHFWHSNLSPQHPNVRTAAQELVAITPEVKLDELSAEDKAFWVMLCGRGGLLFYQVRAYDRAIFYYQVVAEHASDNEKRWGAAYNGACSASLIANAIKGDASKAEAYQRYYEKAFELLELTAALGGGGGEPGHTRKDTDLNILHDDKRWEPLAKRLEANEHAIAKQAAAESSDKDGND